MSSRLQSRKRLRFSTSDDEPSFETMDADVASDYESDIEADSESDSESDSLEAADTCVYHYSMVDLLDFLKKEEMLSAIHVQYHEFSFTISLEQAAYIFNFIKVTFFVPLT